MDELIARVTAMNSKTVVVTQAVSQVGLIEGMPSRKIFIKGK